MSEEALRRDLAALCRNLHARGWVANHDGNVSARLDDERFLASPTAVSKADVSPETLVIVDADGKVVSGTRRVFSEISLHLACFRARPDVRWVVHAHPPTATGWAVSGRSFFDPPFMAEPVVSLGASIPVVPFMAPGTDPGPLADAVSEVDAVLLAGHGALTVAADAETAYLRMELVEHLAHIALVAQQLGGAQPLGGEVVEALLAARVKAGLGPQARAGVGVVSNAPSSGPRPDVSTLVRDALARFG